MVEAFVQLKNTHNLAVEQGECLTVLVPCHNEAATVGELLRRTRAALPLAEIIVIDDGSTDDSVTVAEELQAEYDLIVLRLAARNGKGAAVSAGLLQAQRHWVVIQDADLEYDPRDLQRLATTAHAHPQAAIYGSRYLHHGKAAGGALAPYLGVKFLAILVKLLFGSYLSDTHTCYKMLPTALMRRIALQSTGFELCAEITGKLLKEHVRIIEIPISYQPRSVAAGKKIGARDFFKAIGTYWRCRFQFPLPIREGLGEGLGERDSQSVIRTPTIYFITRFLIGALLVVAGAMKLAPWREIALTDWLVLPAWVVFAIGVGEFLLGCLVLSFANWRFIHRACAAAFSLYIAVLALQLYSGESVCQCLGSRSLPLLWMLALDTSLLASLWLLSTSWRQSLPRGPQSFLGEMLSHTRYALAVLALVGTVMFGSLDAALSYVSGARLIATNSSQYVGRIAGGEIGTASFELTNYSGQAVRVLGAKATCKCVALDDLPLTLAPGISGQIRIRLKGSQGERPQLQREAATLIFDDPTRMLTLSVTATVAPSL